MAQIAEHIGQGRRQRIQHKKGRMMAKQWKHLYGMRATFICPYCLGEFPLKKGTIDHLIPKSRGGTDEPYNLVWSCSRCNGDKGSLTPEEYAIWKTTLDNEVWKKLEIIRHGGVKSK